MSQNPKKSENIIISSVVLSGFRAFLQKEEFSLYKNGTPLSLSIFAPNGKGKSSLVDSVEFFFSEKSTLERLGEKRTARYSGREPLEHVMAKEKGVATEVQLTIINDGKSDAGVRKPKDGTQKPNNAVAISEVAKVDFIIRGYQLRRFVEDMGAEERYEMVSKWLSLSPLVEIQKNLRSTKLKYKALIESDNSYAERILDVAQITNNKHAEWNESALKLWLHSEYILKLNSQLPIPEFDKLHASYLQIQSLKEDEEKGLGLDALKAIITAIRAIYTEKKLDDEKIEVTGALNDFIVSVTHLNSCRKAEEIERNKTSNAIFAEVWQAADKLFSDDKNHKQIDCPVCDTPFKETKAGGYDAIKLNIKTRISNLSGYRAVASNLAAATKDCANKFVVLKSKIDALGASLNTHKFDVKAVAEYFQELNKWENTQSAPDSTNLIAALKKLDIEIESAKNKIEMAQGTCTYSKVLEKLDALIKLKGDLARIDKKLTIQVEMLGNLTLLVDSIDKNIREYIQSVIGKLKELTNTYYKEIQQTADFIPEINIEFASEDAANQKQLYLTINFSENRLGVLPSGYLSDSQLHSLALSFRLSAIKLFNKGLPFIVLDDIVTSYDAEHRLTTAVLLATHFDDFQIILTTHDELFFKCLEERLPRAKWQHKRILKLVSDIGPHFHDHQITEQRIEEEWNQGRHAANLIRQAEEEWLLKICRFFGADVRIRDVHKPYTYSHYELAESLHNYLKGAKISLPEISGGANPFLTTIQSAVFENFGSHFQDTIYAFQSIGDEKKRWKEFVEFRDYFICKGCGNDKFSRPPTQKLPSCKKCQLPFPATKAVQTA